MPARCRTCLPPRGPRRPHRTIRDALRHRRL